MNNRDHISESLETIFGLKYILKFFDADRGSGMEKIKIWDKNPGSATLLMDPDSVPVYKKGQRRM